MTNPRRRAEARGAIDARNDVAADPRPRRSRWPRPLPVRRRGAGRRRTLATHAARRGSPPSTAPGPRLLTSRPSSHHARGLRARQFEQSYHQSESARETDRPADSHAGPRAQLPETHSCLRRTAARDTQPPATPLAMTLCDRGACEFSCVKVRSAAGCTDHGFVHAASLISRSTNSRVSSLSTPRKCPCQALSGWCGPGFGHGEDEARRSSKFEVFRSSTRWHSSDSSST